MGIEPPKKNVTVRSVSWIFWAFLAFACLNANWLAGQEATPVTDSLSRKISEAKPYIKEKGFQDDYAIFIDMAKPSDEKRWFTVDLKSGQLVYETYVAHGKGSRRGRFATEFSDEATTSCTSLGKYRLIGNYNGKHGLSYQLEGLEDCNKNAKKRAIVIHSAWYVEESFIKKYNRCGNSWGCPALSVKALKECKIYLNPSTFLWIYNQ